MQNTRDVSMRSVFGTPLAPGLSDGYSSPPYSMGDAYGSFILEVTSTGTPGAWTALADNDADTWAANRGAECVYWFQATTDMYIRLQGYGYSPNIDSTTGFRILGDLDYYWFVPLHRSVVVAVTTGAATGTLRITKMSPEYSGPRSR